MSKSKSLFLFIILALGLLVRLYKFNAPLADWHSHRQADTVSVTEIFLKTKLDLLHPKYHDLSNVQSGQENPQGYRMVEFPIYNLINYLPIKFFHTDLVQTHRLTNIILSLLTGLVIFGLINHFSKSYSLSILSLSSFLFLPFNIYYSRTTLPDITATFFMVLSWYLLAKNNKLFPLSIAISILIKPYTLIISAPIYLYFFLKEKKLLKYFVYALVTLAPFILWRLWIKQFPEGIPASNWLLNNSTNQVFPAWYKGHDLSWLNKIIAFRPYWFYWLFQDRLSILILGSFGLVPLFFGLGFKNKYLQPLTFCHLLGIFLYFVIIAGGNIQHDYYQILIIPSLTIILGQGFYYLLNFFTLPKPLSFLVFIFLIVFSIYFSWSRVKTYYVINNWSIIKAGEYANKNLPQEAIVIAPYNGDTAFLFQIHRQGYPTEIYNLETIKTLIHQPLYFVSVNNDQYRQYLSKQSKLIYSETDFNIYDLN
ncbi:MAG TPA: hypothetical protein PK370_00255 [Candidatus Woesebacteria bacterium]|nr:hypothetical protein [Candidatus Woesebacteria bacterium]